MNLPTKITVARLVLIPIFILCYCLQAVWDYMFIFTWLVFVVASLTDYVDGHLARKYNLITNLGKFLDPIADKVLVVAGLFVLVDGAYLPIPYLGLICGIIILARELIIGLFRQMAALQDYVLAADNLGKIKTASTMISMSVLFLSPAYMRDLGIFKFLAWAGTFGFIFATVMTVVSGLNYILKNKSILMEEKKDEQDIVIEGVVRNIADEINGTINNQGQNLAQNDEEEVVVEQEINDDSTDNQTK